MTDNALKVLTEFRKSNDKVKALKKVLDSPVMDEVFRILESVAPHNDGLISPTNEPHNNVRLGAILGYSQFRNRMKDLATPIKQTPIIEADYKDTN